MNFILFLPALLILVIYYIYIYTVDAEPTFTVEEYQTAFPSPPPQNEVIGMAFEPIAGPLGNSDRRHAVLLKDAPFIQWV